MDAVDKSFVGWMRQVNARLRGQYGIGPEHVWQDDWHFDWHTSWVAGCNPSEAMQDAVAELRDRGILYEVMAEAGAYSEDEPRRAA